MLAIVAVSLLPLNTFRFMTRDDATSLPGDPLPRHVRNRTIVSSGLAVGAVVVFGYGVEGVFAAVADRQRPGLCVWARSSRPATLGAFERDLRGMSSSAYRSFQRPSRPGCSRWSTA